MRKRMRRDEMELPKLQLRKWTSAWCGCLRHEGVCLPGLFGSLRLATNLRNSLLWRVFVLSLTCSVSLSLPSYASRPFPYPRGRMSINDCHSSNMNPPRPRAASSRVDADQSTPGDKPPQPENMDPLRTGSSSHKKNPSRDVKQSEKRTERTVITTREKAQVRTRNPVMESSSAANRGDPRQKKFVATDAASPNARKKGKEAADCQYSGTQRSGAFGPLRRKC